MSIKVNSPRGGKMNRFVKGESGNPKGRARKWVSELREQGYKLSEVNDAIQAMLSMDIVELNEAFENPASTGLEKAVASAIRKSIEKGDLAQIETLLTRVFGAPKQKTELDVTTGGKPIDMSLWK